jgi:hypothetical protein
MRLYPKIWHWEAAGPCRCVEELNFVAYFCFLNIGFCLFRDVRDTSPLCSRIPCMCQLSRLTMYPGKGCASL